VKTNYSKYFNDHVCCIDVTMNQVINNDITNSLEPLAAEDDNVVEMEIGSESVDYHNVEETRSSVGANNSIAINTASMQYEENTTRLNPIRALLAPFFRRGMSNIRSSWKVLIIAQILSLLLAISGATNATLSFDCKLSAPTMQAGLVYFFLSFHLFFIPRHFNAYESTMNTAANDGNDNDNGAIMTTHEIENEIADGEITRSRGQPRHLLFNRIPLQGSLRMYLIMAFLDVEANYLTYLSFRYTTLTSVSLLDALAIPSAMFFSRFILKRVYRTPHFFGVMICVVGIIVNILGDYQNEISNETSTHVRDDDIYDEDADDGAVPDEMYPHPIRGDVLATAGALLYGLNDVLAERMVKDIGVKEYLGVLGLFGSIICFLQAIITERDSISDFMNPDSYTCQAGEVWTLLGSSVLFGVISYTGMSAFLRQSEAALLNLSLLTGDLWAALFSVVAEHIIPSSHFWTSLVLIVSGVFVYELSQSPSSAEAY
jgi:solute carrier family 35 protein F1/2